jgi:hypothetical protein
VVSRPALQQGRTYMASFKWEIDDASDDSVSGNNGGEVDLGQLRPAKGRSWDLGPPNPDLALEPINSGTIGKIAKPKHVARKSPADEKACISYSLFTDRELVRTVVLFAVLLLGYGFLAVINRQIEQGELDLTTYLKLLVAILTATGIVSVVKANRRKADVDDGSG